MFMISERCVEFSDSILNSQYFFNYTFVFCLWLQMYVTPPDTDIYSIPRVLAPMPQKVSHLSLPVVVFCNAYALLWDFLSVLNC